MFPAFLTTVCFSLSAVLANRSQQVLGPARANLGRLLVGLVFLGLWAFLFGQGLRGAALNQFLLSGVLGMGLSDLAFFAALPRLGSRLTTMMNQCLAVPIAIMVEWLWLDTRLTPAQLACSAVILSGIVLALMPTRANPPRVKVRSWGVVFGVLAAAGQALGAVVSRRGFAVAAAAGEHLDGLTAAFQRIVGGLVLTGTWFALQWWVESRRADPTRTAAARAHQPRDYLWVLGNAFAGPILGMSSYQWALATAPSGIVLPITATTPLVIIPFARWIEGEKSPFRSLVGGAIAVGGAVALTLVS
ncbi:MAG: EamA family transporter [Opitutaceae bacterium]|nr:EamA family transporter [Opitutaceae bacterium]